MNNQPIYDQETRRQLKIVTLRSDVDELLKWRKSILEKPKETQDAVTIDDLNSVRDRIEKITKEFDKRTQGLKTVVERLGGEIDELKKVTPVITQKQSFWDKLRRRR